MEQKSIEFTVELNFKNGNKIKLENIDDKDMPRCIESLY